MNQTLDSVFHYYQTTLGLRSYRQEVIASNIANGDTPGYKSRDFAFGEALTGALRTPDGMAAAAPSPAQLVLTDPAHLSGSAQADAVGHALTQAAVRLKYRLPSQDSADGNTVDMDVERTGFANNAIHYEANITQLTGQIKDLIAAMQST